MSLASYPLEHFYHGPFVRDGQAIGEARVLAHSTGLKADVAADLVAEALLPAPVDAGLSALALVRARKAPFLLVQAGLVEGGAAMRHVILMPSDVLREHGGNLDALLGLLLPTLPSFDRLGDRMDPLPAPAANPPDPEAQIDHLLDLMTATSNRIPVIKALLAAIIRGIPLRVVNAPADLRERVQLVQGLLALLPPPARFGVTFTTHSLPDSRLDAQISFFAGETPRTDAVIFDWAAGAVSGALVDDEYSQFIVSQLRLDTDLVIRQTSALTNVAAWRIRSGDSLSDALAYAANRLSVDDAILNNLPVGAAEAARVLAEDPTLDDGLRGAYARHLLRFAVALNDLSYADPVAPLLHQHSDLDTLTRDYLREAAAGHAGVVFETIARWMSLPTGPRGDAWVSLAHEVAVRHVERLTTARNRAGATDFLEKVHSADALLEIAAIVPRLIDLSLPLTAGDRALTETVFLLAVNYLDADALLRLLRSARFIEPLPRNLGRLVPYLSRADEGTVPLGLLPDVASAFGDQWKPLVLVRLCELALLARRPDLIDNTALAGLAAVAQTSWGDHYEHLLLWIVGVLSEDRTLTSLEENGPRLLLQILLARGAYAELAGELAHHGRLLYPADEQLAYNQMVRALFAEVPLTPDEALTALETLRRAGTRPQPLVMATVGALESAGWMGVLAPLVDDLVNRLTADPALLPAVPPVALLRLLRFQLEVGDTKRAARLASLFPEVAARDGGARLMVRMYQQLEQHSTLRIAGIELLRRYIRLLDAPVARRAITQFTHDLGDEVGGTLEATYIFRRMMRAIDLPGYAEFLHLATQLLYDMALAYSDRGRIPSLGALSNAVQGLPGGLGDDDRAAISRDVLALGRAIAALGGQHRAAAPRGRDAEARLVALLDGGADPVSGLEVLWLIGGYFARGQHFPVSFDRSRGHSPLGERSAPILRDEIQIANDLLRGVLRVFPPDRPVVLSAKAALAEIESMWGEIETEQQRALVRTLATDFQHMAELVAYIAEQGDVRVLEDTGAGRRMASGKQQPRTTLDLCRYISGYFAATRS